jgi:hypothetical protein
MLKPILGFYALGFAIGGNGHNRYFSHPGANIGFLSLLFAYEKGDGVVLMSNQQYSKALGLEIIHALAKQYGWTEFPTDSTFTNPWVIVLISVCFVLTIFFAISNNPSAQEAEPTTCLAFIVPTSTREFR